MPMTFCFYPQHEFACPNLRHCPHLGGAALASVVLVANFSDQSLDISKRTIRGLEERNAKLSSQVVSLQAQLDQVKLELKIERQNKFATNKQKRAEAETTPTSDGQPNAEKPTKKRGAPVGHPGWFRPTATEYDWDIDVKAPNRCQTCNGLATLLPNVDPFEHLQEEIIDGVYCVVLYRHAACRCKACDCRVQQPCEGEILGSRIGPGLRSKAIYLRNVIGITYRKVPRAIKELFSITFTPAALIGFETVLAELA